MTLLDAPAYNARKARLVHRLSIIGASVVVLAAIGAWLWFLQIPWQFWHWPSDHKVNVFLNTVESGDLQKAYGLWNNNPNWQQNPNQYAPYTFDAFSKDWGPSSDYGKITSHRIIVAHHSGNGVIVGVDINGGKTPIFLFVDDRNGTIGFSPVELYSGP
jgi:hypothetical protein